jgi:hypothetical protein
MSFTMHLICPWRILEMMDERLAKRIDRARRELRVAEGTANEEELQAASLKHEMNEFRDVVDASLDLMATLLLEIEFARDETGPLARLTADGMGFELRWDSNHNFELRESENERLLMPIVAGDPQSANRIICAIADHLALAEQRT